MKLGLAWDLEHERDGECEEDLRLSAKLVDVLLGGLERELLRHQREVKERHHESHEGLPGRPGFTD